MCKVLTDVNGYCITGKEQFFFKKQRALKSLMDLKQSKSVRLGYALIRHCLIMWRVRDGNHGIMEYNIIRKILIFTNRNKTIYLKI